MKKFAVIVAGGKGTRMGNELPKQFMLLNGLPILMHSINKFHGFDQSMQIILVLPEAQINEWQRLCRQHHFSVPHQVAKGGCTRFHSVSNGLSLIEEDGIVFIHDGVRPLVSFETIQNCMEGALQFDCAIPVIPLTDSVRQLTDTNNVSVPRDQFRLVQTPQTFKLGLLKQAFQTINGEDCTDDASVFEAAGHSIHLVDGNMENIKITTPIDLHLAEALIKR